MKKKRAVKTLVHSEEILVETECFQKYVPRKQ